MNDDAIVSHLWDFVKMLINGNGDIDAPVAAIFVSEDKPIFLSGERFPTKEGFTEAIKQIVNESDACSVAIISSAWMVKRPAMTTMEVMKTLTPSECEDREEIVLIAYKSRIKNFIETAPIVSDDQSRAVGEIMRQQGETFNRFLDGVFTSTIH